MIMDNLPEKHNICLYHSIHNQAVQYCMLYLVPQPVGLLSARVYSNCCDILQSRSLCNHFHLS